MDAVWCSTQLLISDIQVVQTYLTILTWQYEKDYEYRIWNKKVEKFLQFLSVDKLLSVGNFAIVIECADSVSILFDSAFFQVLAY